MLFIAGCGERQAGASSPPLGPAYAIISHSNYVPAGSTVVIRTKEAIQAVDAAPGRFFSAEITQPVLNQRGEVLIPRGSQAVIDVVQSRGRGAAAQALALALRSVTVDGDRYVVRTLTETEPLTDEMGAGYHRRAGMMIGGGALLGTFVGVVADGEETTLHSGSGAGVIVAGETIDVPSQTLLNFRLDAPMMLQGFGQ